MTVSVFDHPLLSPYLGDAEVAALFSVAEELAAILEFEAALAYAEAKCKVIPDSAAAAIQRACRSLKPNLKSLATGTARDGMVVPTLVAQLQRTVGKKHAQYVHLGATSQDAIDTGLMLRLNRVAKIIARRATELTKLLKKLEARQSQQSVMGRTRMRQALPIPLAHRIRNWRLPVEHLASQLNMIQTAALVLQLGGPVGSLESLGSKGASVARHTGARLRLPVPGHSWHTDRSRLVEFADWLARMSGSVGKIGTDICLMYQDELAEIALPAGGTSSSMPHKSNPVQAEAMVALARFTATLVGGMHQSQPHELERSGTAWTLEWMLLPQLTVATAAGLRLAHETLATARFGAAAPGANSATSRSSSASADRS